MSLQTKYNNQDVGRWRGSCSAAIMIFAASILLHSSPATAQPSPSLAGRTVQVIVGFGAGGGFDMWGRLVARHIGRHLPGNPTVVVQNMPGAGGFIAVNHIYNVAPKDGTAIAIVASSTPLGPINGATGARFDTTKLTWLGTPTIDTNTCVARNSPQVKVKTLADLYENELVVGGTGPGAGTYAWPKGLSGLLGLKFKVIGGFPSASNVLLAIERGEVEGICQTGLMNLRPEWIANKTVNVLLQSASASRFSVKGVPVVTDLAKTAEQRAALEFLYAGESIGRPFFAPPDLPADRAKMLQDAFMATMRDPDFLSDANKQNLEVDPKDSAYLTEVIRRVYATPKEIIDRVSALTK
jgi:tripartite-type tricarboxylate transporter receptor subunit TctC